LSPPHTSCDLSAQYGKYGFKLYSPRRADRTTWSRVEDLVRICAVKCKVGRGAKKEKKLSAS